MSAVLDAILDHAARDPDGIAIDGDGAIRWRELAASLPAIADRVRSRFGSTRPLGLVVDYGVAEAVLDLALLEAGVITVPIPRFFTAAQRAAALRACGAQGTVEGPVDLRSLLSGTLDVRASSPDTAPVPLPAGTVRITFTSGSTGDPKGVCLARDHLLQVAGAVVSHLGSNHVGRHLPLLPPGILLENVAGFYAVMLAGGAYVAASQTRTGLTDPFRPDVAAMLRSIVELDATSLILVPEYLAGLVAAMTATGARLPRLTLVAVGGARVPPALLEAAAAVGLPVRQGYGLTECASVVALDDGTAMGSVGRSIGVNAISIAEDGEIVLGGPHHLGTIGSPAPDGPLHTGDIGRLDADGRLWIDGRKSSLIVTSYGRNVSPEWIEGALVAQPQILQAMVRGDGQPVLDALLVPSAPDADVDAAVAAVNDTLPAYARIGRWRLVPPFTPANGQLTGNGRLRRAAIAQAYPDADDVEADRPFFERLAAETQEARARFAMTPQLLAGLTGRISRNDYIAYLNQAYHHVRHTVPLMQAARARLGHKPLLVEALDDYIVEETGHEEWILDDIAAAGGNRRAAADSAPAPATKAMVDHAYRTIREGNPAAFFGMVFVLEGTSIALASNGAAAVQSALGLPDDAFRYLTSHGALDQDHMKFFERLMNRIDDPDDQQAIIAMARDMFMLFGGVFASIELEGLHVAA